MRKSCVLPLLALLAVSACSGAPAPQPDFDVTTSSGPANVSIRETPPEMTFAEFQQAVQTGMRSAMPGGPPPTCAAAALPDRRIVWHVYPIFPRGASRLVVNVFDGPVRSAHAEQVIDDTAPASSIEYAVRTLTGRLALG